MINKQNRQVLLSTIVILFVFLFASQSVDFVTANPFSQSAYSGERAPSTKVEPPIVTVLSPENKKGFNTNNISLNLNVSTKNSQTIRVEDLHFLTDIDIQEISYFCDWQQNKTLIYRIPTINEIINNTAKYYFMGKPFEKYNDIPKIDFEDFYMNFTNIPDGNHSIRISAVGSGSEYYIFNWYKFYVTSTTKIDFFVDTAKPAVLLSIENKTYATSEIQLNFTSNETISHILYSLDKQNNVTLSENTTLTNLSNGAHNVTFYAWDSVGNVALETVFFNVKVPDPFPTTVMVAVIAVSSTCFGALGLVRLVRFKIRKFNLRGKGWKRIVK